MPARVRLGKRARGDRPGVRHEGEQGLHEDRRRLHACARALSVSELQPQKPDRKTLILVGKHFAKGLPVHRSIPGRLRKLGEPAAGAKAWDAIRSLALEDNTIAIAQVSDALAGDAKAFVSTVHRLQSLHKQLVAKALASGFSKSTPCGDSF
jgi:hypothetical protein